MKNTLQVKIAHSQLGPPHLVYWSLWPTLLTMNFLKMAPALLCPITLTLKDILIRLICSNFNFFFNWICQLRFFPRQLLQNIHSFFKVEWKKFFFQWVFPNCFYSIDCCHNMCGCSRWNTKWKYKTFDQSHSWLASDFLKSCLDK